MYMNCSFLSTHIKVQIIYLPVVDADGDVVSNVIVCRPGRKYSMIVQVKLVSQHSRIHFQSIQVYTNNVNIYSLTHYRMTTRCISMKKPIDVSLLLNDMLFLSYLFLII